VASIGSYFFGLAVSRIRSGSYMLLSTLNVGVSRCWSGSIVVGSALWATMTVLLGTPTLAVRLARDERGKGGPRQDDAEQMASRGFGQGHVSLSPPVVDESPACQRGTSCGPKGLDA